MVIDKEDGVAIIFRESASLDTFLLELTQAHARLKHENLIINLVSFANIDPAGVLKFRQLSDAHRKGKKSFVVVTDKVSYDEVPEDLLVVPTLQEAKDLIEMEEIERDLDL